MLIIHIHPPLLLLTTHHSVGSLFIHSEEEEEEEEGSCVRALRNSYRGKNVEIYYCHRDDRRTRYFDER